LDKLFLVSETVVKSREKSEFWNEWKVEKLKKFNCKNSLILLEIQLQIMIFIFIFIAILQRTFKIKYESRNLNVKFTIDEIATWIIFVLETEIFNLFHVINDLWTSICRKSIQSGFFFIEFLFHSSVWKRYRKYNLHLFSSNIKFMKTYFFKLDTSVKWNMNFKVKKYIFKKNFALWTKMMSKRVENFMFHTMFWCD
jgi:hypothetical protein